MKQLPQDKKPLAQSGSAQNMQGHRVQAAAAAPVSFSEQFKNDKTQLIASSQVSAVTETAANNSKKVAARTNPFQKNLVKNAEEIAASQTVATKDVFADLKKSAGTSKLDQMSATLLQKRTNVSD